LLLSCLKIQIQNFKPQKATPRSITRIQVLLRLHAICKTHCDQLGAAGNPISDEELISSILNGLNSNFTHFITTYSFHTKAKEFSYEDFQDELITHEMLLSQHQNHT
jgi:hypothetical protein